MSDEQVFCARCDRKLDLPIDVCVWPERFGNKVTVQVGDCCLRDDDVRPKRHSAS